MFPQTYPSKDQMRMQAFRHRMERAPQTNFLGGFPNFHEATYGFDTVGGTIFIRPAAGKWSDVPLTDLDNVPLEDFGARMRATNAFANRNGFVGGIPTYFHANYGNGVVCGTVVLNSEGAEWQDVLSSDLGNPRVDDIEGRFRSTQDYADRNGFVGGFPNLFHADYGNGTVYGTVLLKPGFAEWRDVFLYRGPA